MSTPIEFTFEYTSEFTPVFTLRKYFSTTFNLCYCWIYLFVWHGIQTNCVSIPQGEGRPKNERRNEAAIKMKLRFVTGVVDTFRSVCDSIKSTYFVFCWSRCGLGLIVVNQIDNAVIKITNESHYRFPWTTFWFSLSIAWTSKVQSMTIKSSKIFLLLGFMSNHTAHSHNDLMCPQKGEGLHRMVFNFKESRKGFEAWPRIVNTRLQLPQTLIPYSNPCDEPTYYIIKSKIDRRQ